MINSIDNARADLAAALSEKTEAQRDLETKTAEHDTCDPSDAVKTANALTKAAAILRAAERVVDQCTAALADAERDEKVATLEALTTDADADRCREVLAQRAQDVVSHVRAIGTLLEGMSTALESQRTNAQNARAIAKELRVETTAAPRPDGLARAVVAVLLGRSGAPSIGTWLSIVREETALLNVVTDLLAISRHHDLRELSEREQVDLALKGTLGERSHALESAKNAKLAESRSRREAVEKEYSEALGDFLTARSVDGRTTEEIRDRLARAEQAMGIDSSSRPTRAGRAARVA